MILDAAPFILADGGHYAILQGATRSLQFVELHKL